MMIIIIKSRWNKKKKIHSVIDYYYYYLFVYWWNDWVRVCVRVRVSCLTSVINVFVNLKRNHRYFINVKNLATWFLATITREVFFPIYYFEFGSGKRINNFLSPPPLPRDPEEFFVQWWHKKKITRIFIVLEMS